MFIMFIKSSYITCQAEAFYSVTIDGKLIYRYFISNPKTFYDVKVFAGDKYYPALDASYKNLVWINLPVPEILLNRHTPPIVSLEKNILIQIMINSQVTVPRYRENPLMLCPGISLNIKQQHLTLFKGQVWRKKSYLELCSHNSINVFYHLTATTFGASVPGRGFLWDETNIPWDSEILQSFAGKTNITNIIYQMDNQYQLAVGSFLCSDKAHSNLCAPPHRYIPWYIWTKEGFKIGK